MFQPKNRIMTPFFRKKKEKKVECSTYCMGVWAEGGGVRVWCGQVIISIPNYFEFHGYQTLICH